MYQGVEQESRLQRKSKNKMIKENTKEQKRTLLELFSSFQGNCTVHGIGHFATSQHCVRGYVLFLFSFNRKFCKTENTTYCFYFCLLPKSIIHLYIITFTNRVALLYPFVKHTLRRQSRRDFYQNEQDIFVCRKLGSSTNLENVLHTSQNFYFS